MFSMMFLAAIFMSMKSEVQHISKTYPRETLASRIHNISKDYNVNIGYRPEQCDFEIPEVTLMNAGIEQALTISLDSTLFAYRKKTDNTFVVYKKEQQQKQPIEGKGIIKGKITDEKGESLPGANVWVPALQIGAVTDSDGNYSFSVLSGTYTIEISFISYQAQQVTMVKVSEGKTTPLNVKLLPATEDIEEVKVTAEYKRESTKALYAIQKETVSLTDGISAEQIKQLPASNVAQVLKKVSGITVKSDKYVVVRGMSERYNNVQLNSSSLPSTEPNRRNFSFDIIPSNLIENVVVHKTFSPDLPGEFAGGLVNVNTISIPQKNFFSISVGTGINTNSTGKDFYSTKRQNGDYFGGAKDRVWYKRTFDPELYYSDYDLDAPGENMLAQITNIPNNWGLYKYKAQPKQSYAISFGKPFEINNSNTIGLVVAGTYQHNEEIEDFWAKYRKNEGDTTNFANKYKFNTTIGAIGNVAWRNKNGTKVNFRNLYNRRFSYSNIVQEIESLENDVVTFSYYSSIKMNTLWQTRFDGEHKLIGDNLVVDWFADYSKMNRKQPDDSNSSGIIKEKYEERNYLLYYDFQGINPNNGMSVYADELTENQKNIGLNLTSTFNMLGNKQKVKAGYSGSFRSSDYDQISLVVVKGNQALIGLPDKELGKPEHYGVGKLSYTSITGNSVLGQGYEGNQAIHAGYLMAELLPLKKLAINGGVRLEHEIMDVRTSQRMRTEDGQHWVDSTITYPSTKYLPSLTLIYKITNEAQLKAAWNKTLTRVDFKERSAFQYYDVEERGFMLGNGGLESGYAKNYDLRFEWYPKPGEIISIGTFYKYFVKPIELITYNEQSGGYRFMYFNLDDATTKGLEFDLRKSFGFISPTAKFLNNLYVSANFTLLDGDVTYNAQKLAIEAQGLDYEEDSTSHFDPVRSRTLQGLSPVIYNVGVNYQGKRLEASININHTGRTLILAGTTIELDEYDAPYDQLDAQLNIKFFDQRMNVKLNVSNLLNKSYIRYRNYNPNDVNMPYSEDPEKLDYNPDYDWTLKRINKGTSYSISLSYKF